MPAAVIIDDEPNNIENLSLLLANYCPQISIIGHAGNADEGVRLIKNSHPDLVFLDIQMPGKTGLDLLKTFTRPSFEVIFVTAFDQYAIQAIRFSAIDYLLKPVHIDELIQAVDKALAHIETKKQNERLENLLQLLENKSLPKIAVPSKKETLFIDVAAILFCEASNNYTFIHLTNGQKHLSSKPIFEYEELLQYHGFLRSHQSYIVNRAYIQSWIREGGDRLLLTGGAAIPVSRNKKETIKKAIAFK